VVSILLAGAASAMPMALMMLAVVLATEATFFALVLRRSAGNEL
jgi:hypothetical protein